MAEEINNHKGFHVNWQHVLIGLFGLLLVGGLLITTAFLMSLVGDISSLHREVATLHATDDLQRTDFAALTTKVAKIESGYAGLQSDVEMLQTQNVAQNKALDALSRVVTDIEAITIRVAATEKTLQERTKVIQEFDKIKETVESRTKIIDDLRQANIQIQSQLQSVLPEIETQFCMEDNIRNLNHANDLRTMSSLWQKVFGQPLATSNAFYPEVCSRTTSATAHAASPNTAVPK